MRARRSGRGRPALGWAAATLCLAALGCGADGGPVAAPGDGGALSDASGPTRDGEAGCVPADEACNGLDDDCDGQVDEGDGGLRLARACYDGPAGTDAVGGCRAGRRVCSDGAFGPCLDAVLPAAEACNTLDDDCDGRADEGACGCTPDAVEPCGPGAAFDGVGLCAAGQRRCATAGAWGPCLGGVGPRDETCDGEDEDCDGHVDEVPGLAAACVVGEGACARDGGWACVPGEPTPRCVAPAPRAIPEVCDGEDQDRDGRVDEEVARNPCVAGVGGCRRDGTTACVEGRLTCDAQPGAPEDERCNGADDDCDNRIDEGTLNACGHCGPAPTEVCNGRDDDCDRAVDERQGIGARCTAGLGICARAGFETCDAGHWTCTVQPHPAQEEGCNGLDDDCDGRVDEGVTNACGGCGPLVEICDGADNDCDGAVDEGFQVGVPCSAGTGACARDAVRVCRDGLGVCPAVAGAPRPEQCDGVDDDCDGPIDEGFDVGAACTLGRFRCAREGERVCRDGAAVCDAEVVPTEPETCNHVDDDCDGAVDEGFAHNACGDCGPTPDEVCNAADDDCDGAVDEALPDGPCGGCGPTPVELCNDRDDDCDGAVDEGLRNACGRCGPPPVEVCNALDEDCDGRVDEDLPRTPCGTCEGLSERCNAIDDDCDGAVDEDSDVQDLPCTVPWIDGVCAQGLGTCRRGRFECVSAVEPSAEVCNGLDDDCDGLVDNLAPFVLETGVPATFVQARLIPGPDGLVLAVWRDSEAGAPQQTQLLTPEPALVGPMRPLPEEAGQPLAAAVPGGWLLFAGYAGPPFGARLYTVSAADGPAAAATFEGGSVIGLVPHGEGAVAAYRLVAEAAVVLQPVTAAGALDGAPVRVEVDPRRVDVARLGDDLLLAYVHQPPGATTLRLTQHRVRREADALVIAATAAEQVAFASLQLIPLPGAALRVTGLYPQPDIVRVTPDLVRHPASLPFDGSAIWSRTDAATWLAGRLPATPVYRRALVSVDGEGTVGPAQGIGLPLIRADAVAVVEDAALTLSVVNGAIAVQREPLCNPQ